MFSSIQSFFMNFLNGSAYSSVNNDINLKSVAEWTLNPKPLEVAITKAMGNERALLLPELVGIVVEYLHNFEALPFVFGPLDWEVIFNRKVEIINPPREMLGFLQKINPFTGRLNSESCLCVFIPSHFQNVRNNLISNVNLDESQNSDNANNSLIPLTPNTIAELAKNPINPINRSNYRNFLDAYNSSKEIKEVRNKLLNLYVNKSYWIVITKNIIPDSQNKFYADQLGLIEKGAKEYWQSPSLRETIIAAFAYHAKTGNRILDDRTYTRCFEMVDDSPTVVGGFSAWDGLLVGNNAYNYPDVGIIALRRSILIST